MEHARLIRSLRLIATIVGGGIFGLSLGLAIVSVLATQFFNYHILTVDSGSMAPGLKKGDIAIIQPASITKVTAGDIVYVTENSGLPLVHRVAAVDKIVTVARDQQGTVVGQTTDFKLRTKGDANPSPDADEIDYRQFHGSLWFSVPTFGLLTAGDLTPQVLLFGVAGVIALLWASWELARRARSRKPALEPSGDAGAGLPHVQLPVTIESDRSVRGAR